MSLRVSLSSLALLSVVCLLALLGGSPAGAGAAGNANAGVTPVNSSACRAVQYGGAGEAQALIVSDLPLQGASRERSLQMNDAIVLTLQAAGWQAGGRNVAFQECSDSVAKTGLWSKAQCKGNAKAYAADRSVIGVVGTYNSGCAEVEIPILGAAPGGGLAMVSPGNTLICLTQASPSCPKGQPHSLYPEKHNYVRVVPNDAYQGAGLASFAKSKGIHRAYILYAGGDPTSLGQAKTFRGAARKLGVKITGFAPWNVKASSYKGLMRKVKATSSDALLLAGLIEEKGGTLIKDKVSVLGRNDGAVKLLAPDGFAEQSTIKLAGAASKGMFASLPGIVPAKLTGRGAKLVSELEREVGNGAVELFAPYAGEAANVLLGAIGKSGTRGGVISAVTHAKVSKGITGSFHILPSGDPSVSPVTVSVARKTFVPVRELRPSQTLVKAARKGR